MRQCKRCLRTKPLSDFHSHPASKGGYRIVCVECVKAQNKERYYANLEQSRAGARKRSREYRARGGDQGKDSAKEYRRLRQWIADNPLKYRAHERLNDAVRRGKIKRQPCEVCGTEPTHAHHEDYTKPLEVRWLCPRHHGAEHRAGKAA